MPSPSAQYDRSVLGNLFEKIDLIPVYEVRSLEGFQDNDALSTAPVAERLTRALGVLMATLTNSGCPIGSLDKSLLDFHIDALDQHVNQCLDTVMHSTQFQTIESAWRGLKFLVDRTDFRKNVKIEVLDCSKETLQQDFDDTPEVIQSGLYHHAYIQEYDTPGGQPISAIISDFEFVNSAKDIALLRNISKVAAAAHMPFIGAVGPAFFGKKSMEDVVGIQEISDYFDRADYLKWMAFRCTEDARYIGLTMPRVLGRHPYGPDNTPVRDLNYREMIKGTDPNRFLWVSASFAFAANMVHSFVRNGWCVQVRGPQAGGKVAGLPVHQYDLGTGFQNKISAEVLIPETREFEFANLGFMPLSFFENHDFACFFSANSVQKPALYATPEATGNSRINARLPYIFLLSRIAHHLKLIQRENIGTTKDRRLLEVELNNWIKTLVTEMTDPTDDLQAAHPLRQAEVSVEDIEDNPGFFRVRLFVVPHFQVEGMDVGLSMVSQMPRDKCESM
ncbi:type VI secretion system contractile sheath large subunit [Caballeronia udeis]|uniref:type VI secretion system contractile sheath large subunit n=1 Tax=Caballeronia udeis TaxID=1232866 RepID=UPI000780B01C|nr:type VI secretion system contractile sheath large subunit [Caballeronia udeis]